MSLLAVSQRDSEQDRIGKDRRQKVYFLKSVFFYSGRAVARSTNLRGVLRNKRVSHSAPAQTEMKRSEIEVAKILEAILYIIDMYYVK